MCDLKFRKANKSELPDVVSLYQRSIGREGCTWVEEYPTEREACYDLAGGNLYVLTECGTIIGAVSVAEPNELEEYCCWKLSDGTQREVSRVVIDERCAGRGLAQFMLNELFAILKNAGCSAVHLAAACCNPAAVRTYQKMGFDFLDVCEMYGNRYFLCEKKL